MILFRSTLCNILMLFWTLLCGVAGLPFVFVRQPHGVFAVIRGWGKGVFLIARFSCGITMKIEGDVPHHGRMIIASKHQSAWETIAYALLLESPAFVLKRELTRIPLIGWYLLAIRSIAIDRKAGKKALVQVVEQSLAKLEEGRQVVIFPEGTRVKHGEKRKYHGGVAAVYAQANRQVVPVALNSGLCWPKNSWKKYPGTITLRFLEPIQPGLPHEEFMRLLEERIEAAQVEL